MASFGGDLESIHSIITIKASEPQGGGSIWFVFAYPYWKKMSLNYRAGSGEDAVDFSLRDPRIAALLGWLWPGAGHFYQGRYVKCFIFMICIVSIFVYGMVIGQGRVVYASNRPNDFRWQFIPQSGFGIPSILAVAQSLKITNQRPPFLVLCERFPAGYIDDNGNLREFEKIPADELAGFEGQPLYDGFMAPPSEPIILERNDVLGMWHAEMRHFFDLGTLFTVVAGLLNFLAIYDAFAGPAIQESKGDQEVV
ncbi:MAG: hypothetical protein GY819_08230 [Planctomycetaceae bacterium]|nr:hypothetical protein [Planctomycetaceae bacterium]MCP4462768.1 hypothetical protein [Planctomycetaceae bacterium]